MFNSLNFIFLTIMLSDLNYIVFWWLIIFFLGSLSLPLVFKLFKNFWDKGYIFSKIISITLITYLSYVLGIFKFLTFTQTTFFSIILFLIIFNITYLSKKNNLKNFKEILLKKKKNFILEELIFLLILIFWSFIRAYKPDIDNLEKFMDWGFVNSMLRTEFMPPVDMWFSGEPINYYYFGHLYFAFLTKLSGINSAITYNLSMATVCALTFSSAFSLASNLVFSFLKKHNNFVIPSEVEGSLANARCSAIAGLKSAIIAGFVSALLLTFGGNLHTVYKIAKINIKNEGKLTLTKSAILKATQSYWYPDATRFIGFDPDIEDKTIHEFPLYSFVVADLHGHMNDIPVVLFLLSFLFSYSINNKKKKGSKMVNIPIDWSLVIPVSLTLSIAFMTNAWDFFVYGLFFAIFTLFYNLSKYKAKIAITKTIFNGISVILFWYIFTLPFSINFDPMMEGLLLSDSHTPLYQLLVLYGGFWLICLPFILYVIFKNVILITRRGRRISSESKNPVLFVSCLILTATILVIIPEIGYIKDIYIYSHRRANTMFKLTYQGFMMYSIACGFVLIFISKTIKTKIIIFLFKIIFVLVFVSHLVYPYFAIRSNYESLKSYKGLYGLNFIKDRFPDNYQAILWINKNISGQPVMLEAVGDSYTDFNQISMSTGLPTVEGWIVHEWLWRGGYEKPSARQIDVQKIYESEDLTEVISLLQKYSVDYIFVGDKEYEKYPNLNEETFINLNAKIIAQFGQTKIYKLDK
ncbi:hypothetical protein KKB16_04195 [Patescibacteria group bacterium]|nr:hypothetical protein [Patescibacteria group bacterium]MBU4431276.1 hypothetical protein [Patescibacteria group bacterium]MBU4578538.1 hypothetical protein [Patescibacteria group bacterium]